MARPDHPSKSQGDEQVVIFEEAMAAHEERVLEDLAEATGRTPEEIREAVAEYEMPDPEELERIPAEEFYGEE